MKKNEAKTIKSFKDYLVKSGYSVESPTGSQSTVKRYSRCIQTVCDLEGCSVEYLSANIDDLISKYEDGEMRQFNIKDRRSTSNALKRWKEFLAV